ncbi:DUF948 domain-containing protein [Marinisporobacter balticus]|uniref:Uncharacterized protein DUF948 n=1 Tax=Marinisporobacter balticus TaxID=2018667 RepID=A0A4R2KVU3_9FIRM|nr:DUF948 domain-containing protein [Marinisporobacter balticus]TCO78631.1 uncharacterized protein DUF948 [Marinisporobacter balticus]
MDVQISLGDLGIMLLGFSLFVLIIYAILLLKNLTDTIKVFRSVLQDNQSNIEQILNQVPSIAQNVESISSDLSRDVKAVQHTFDNMIGKTEVAAARLTKNKDVLSSIAGVMQVIYFIKKFMRTFPLKKKSF